jgi:hypothetical protein
MLYRRRLIHKSEATMPTPAPSKNFVAKNKKERSEREGDCNEWKMVTDITPNGDGVEKVAGPNQTIDEFNETSERNPKHVGACPRVPSL